MMVTRWLTAPRKSAAVTARVLNCILWEVVVDWSKGGCRSCGSQSFSVGRATTYTVVWEQPQMRLHFVLLKVCDSSCGYCWRSPMSRWPDIVRDAPTFDGLGKWDCREVRSWLDCVVQHMIGWVYVPCWCSIVAAYFKLSTNHQTWVQPWRGPRGISWCWINIDSQNRT